MIFPRIYFQILTALVGASGLGLLVLSIPLLIKLPFENAYLLLIIIVPVFFWGLGCIYMACSAYPLQK